VRTSTGNYLGRRGSNIDVTERMRNELALQRNLHEKEVLLQEVHHRVKNNLQMVSSLISLQRHTTTDPSIDRQLETIAGRIDTMGALHTTIYREDSFESVDMNEYLSTIISRVREMSGRTNEIECTVRVSRIELVPSRALPVGLIVHEGLTNAHKHAFSDGRTGTIDISLERTAPESVRLVIRDDGTRSTAPCAGSDSSVTTDSAAERTAPGIGLKLVELLTRQLNGQLSVRTETGYSLEIVFPDGD
jgi:two-component sensor histidine kinase